jgi:hypothetical protein
VASDRAKGFEGLAIERYDSRGRPISLQPKIVKQQVIVHRRIGKRIVSQVINVGKKEEESSEDDDESDIEELIRNGTIEEPLLNSGASSFMEGK